MENWLTSLERCETRTALQSGDMKGEPLFSAFLSATGRLPWKSDETQFPMWLVDGAVVDADGLIYCPLPIIGSHSVIRSRQAIRRWWSVQAFGVVSLRAIAACSCGLLQAIQGHDDRGQSGSRRRSAWSYRRRVASRRLFCANVDRIRRRADMAVYRHRYVPGCRPLEYLRGAASSDTG